jgi:hypothetical protein
MTSYFGSTPQYGSLYIGQSGFRYKKIGGGGAHARPALGLICGQNNYYYNKYKPGGEGVGALSIAVRRARNRKATICLAQGNNCCNYYNYLGLYNKSYNPNGFFVYPTTCNDSNDTPHK